MKMTPYLPARAGLVLALGGCNMAGEAPNQSEAPAEAAAAPAAPLAGVFVARQGPGELDGMKARFPGRWGLRGGCLVFEGAGVTYLPVLARTTPVSVHADRVEIGGRTHAFDSDTVVTGGAADRSAAATLDQKPPAGCPWPLLRVSGTR